MSQLGRMTKTTVRNKTKYEISLNEGNGGIQRSVCVIKVNEPYIVKSKLNQTYKEYCCASNSSIHSVTLNSDDLFEWEQVDIIEPVAGEATLVWIGITKRVPKTANRRGSSSGWVEKLPLVGKIPGWWNQRHKSQGAAGGAAAGARPGGTTDGDATPGADGSTMTSAATQSTPNTLNVTPGAAATVSVAAPAGPSARPSAAKLIPEKGGPSLEEGTLQPGALLGQQAHVYDSSSGVELVPRKDCFE